MTDDIFTRDAPNPESQSSKLCLDYLAERWATSTGKRASEFVDSVQNKLDARTLSRQELDSRFMDALMNREIERHGTDAGKKIFEQAKELWSCK